MAICGEKGGGKISAKAFPGGESGSEESTALSVLGRPLKAFPSLVSAGPLAVRLCFYCTWYRDSLEQSLLDVRALPFSYHKLPGGCGQNFSDLCAQDLTQRLAYCRFFRSTYWMNK